MTESGLKPVSAGYSHVFAVLANAGVTALATAVCLTGWNQGWDGAPLHAFAALCVVLHLPFAALPLGLHERLGYLASQLPAGLAVREATWSKRARASLARPACGLLMPQVVAAPILAWASLAQEHAGTFALVVGVLTLPFACLTGWLFLVHDLLADLVQAITVRTGSKALSGARLLHLGANAMAKGALVYAALFICTMQPPFVTGISIALFLAGLNVRRISDRLRDLDDLMRVQNHRAALGEEPATGGPSHGGGP